MDRTPEEDAARWESVMVDVSDMSLTELSARANATLDPDLPDNSDETPDNPLVHNLRRLRDGQPDEPIAGFNSAL